MQNNKKGGCKQMAFKKAKSKLDKTNLTGRQKHKQAMAKIKNSKSSHAVTEKNKTERTAVRAAMLSSMAKEHTKQAKYEAQAKARSIAQWESIVNGVDQGTTNEGTADEATPNVYPRG